MSYGISSISVKCADMLEARPFPSRPYCFLNAVVEDEMRLVLVDDFLRPSGAWDRSRTRGLHGGRTSRTGNGYQPLDHADGRRIWLSGRYQEETGSDNCEPLYLKQTDPTVIRRKRCAEVNERGLRFWR